MSSLRDLIAPIPTGQKELADYVTGHYEQVKEALDKNKGYQATLENVISHVVDKYRPYLGGIAQTVGEWSRHTIGNTADAWMLSGDIIGALGGKFLNLIGQIPEKLIAAPIYAIKTGNYLDAFQNLLEGAINYIPFPGMSEIADGGLSRIVKKRMVKEIVSTFEKEIGIYKPWTSRLADKLSGIYSGVKDRVGNVFRPDYDPSTPVHALA